ncbi:hypothetical protein [Leptolyngbya sp. 7M]|uniref:hypothetical protein n=1 Tax=Leptolyngbya sp. 7M TaxID=2812896 RepID=UPI001B8AA01A|nr:hypothetical protein [Leptolyngbya sp. 7M]QYO64496.1 hypothetical protein JVX88_33295 [Leptolyngbya sp. 7M]
MTLILTQSDWEELCQQTSILPDNLVLDDFEEFMGVPEPIGHGYSRGMELSPGLWLSFLDREFHQDWILKTPIHDHSIQIGVFLSGLLYFDEVYPNLGGRCSYFSGSGIE